MNPIRKTKYDYSEIKEITSKDGTLYWTRPCPICKKEIRHISIIAVKNCHRNKRKCSKCGNWNRGLNIHTSESLKKWEKNILKE